MYCSVTVLDGRFLYAVGGLDGTDALDSVEVYDPDTDTWAMAPPLGQRVCGCGLAVMDCVRGSDLLLLEAGGARGGGADKGRSSGRPVPLIMAEAAGLDEGGGSTTGPAAAAADTGGQAQPQAAAASSSQAPPSPATN